MVLRNDGGCEGSTTCASRYISTSIPRLACETTNSSHSFADFGMKHEAEIGKFRILVV